MAGTRRNPDAGELRRRAESWLGAGGRPRGSAPAQRPAAPETIPLVHELQVHQVELELQNEELERARTEAEEALARYTDLYEYAPVGYLTLARDGTLLQVNLNGARLLGQPRSGLVGRRFALLLCDRWRPVFQAFLEAAFAVGGTRAACELEVRPDSAPPLTLELTGQAVEDGQSCRVVALDVTERKKLQAAQAERLASIGLLAAGVAHEVNNPLAYVLFNLESLARDLPRQGRVVQRCVEALRAQGGDEALHRVGPDGRMLTPAALEELCDWARQALGGTQRIADIMGGLGSFARVEPAERGWVDLEATVDDAVRLASNQLRFRARLVREFARVPPVWACAGMLGQVFLNLLLNAVHAIPEGHAESNRITVRTWRGDDGVFAEVADTGAGIHPEDLGRVFEPFFSTKGPGTGAGLGLTLCRNIVNEFGGEISVESRRGEGSRFLIRLPLLKLPPGLVARPRVPSGPDADAASGAEQVRGRVLMIDDDPGLRSMMIRLLDQHEVHTAASAREAQALLGRDPDFDVILCDVMMPGMSGPQLHQWFLGQSPELAARFVFITGGTFTPDSARYLALVDNPKLAKPFNTEGLRRLVGERVFRARHPEP